MSAKKSSKKVSSKNTVPIRPRVEVPAPSSSNTFIDDFRRMQQRMDALFDHFWETPFYSPLSSDVFRDRFSPMIRDVSLSPSANVWENEKEVGLSVDLPGMEKKDIQLNITPDRVEIRAEKKHEHKREEKNSFAWEHSHSSFYRSFALPSHADSSKAKATFENGVLRVTIPKIKSLPSNVRKLEIE